MDEKPRKNFKSGNGLTRFACEKQLQQLCGRYMERMRNWRVLQNPESTSKSEEKCQRLCIRQNSSNLPRNRTNRIQSAVGELEIQESQRCSSVQRPVCSKPRKSQFSVWVQREEKANVSLKAARQKVFPLTLERNQSFALIRLPAH